MFGICAILGGGAFGSSVEAQTIRYKVGTANEVTQNAGEDFEINVGTVSGTLLVRIWDPTPGTNGLPNDSAGKVTITGSYSSGQLRILVAGNGDNWSNNPDSFLTAPGLHHLGLDGNDGIVVTDATLRAKTRLSAYTVGDIRGTITLGQVQRVQCGADAVNPVGELSAAITTLAGYNAFGADENPIGAIIAGDAISGNITATLGSIGLIQVGPNEGAAGISGDIIADAGAIKSIFTTGPIDSGTSTLLKINAANGIGQIRTAASATGELAALSVEADIISHQAILDETYTFVSPNADGTLSLLDVGGDLRGSIRVANLTCNTTIATSCARTGIFVDGICYAPVRVDFNVTDSNIVARTFIDDVHIGYSLSGTVVATGGATTPNDPPAGYADGNIPSISIGNDELPLDPMPVGYSLLVPGIVSGNFTRTVPTDPEYWFLRTTTSQTIDSVVHAEGSIGTATIRALQAGKPGVCTKYPPAVEAPVIGEIRIDALANGVVWSGQFDSQDPSVSYATIDTFSAGCIRQIGSVWAQGWSSFVVDTDLYGDIHVPEIEADQLIQVGRIFGNEDAVAPPDEPEEWACECTAIAESTCDACDWQWNYLHEVFTLDNPRNPWWPAYLPDGGDTGDRLDPDRRGQVWVHETAGLHGHIVINASNNTTLTASQLWSGAVQVGIGTNGSPTIEIAPTATGDWDAPYYDGLSAALGGGAVGLAPFHLHDKDCAPPLDGTMEDRTFLNSQFSHMEYGTADCEVGPYGEPYTAAAYKEIVLSFYGPVTFESSTEPAFTIRRDGFSIAYEEMMLIERITEPGSEFAHKVRIRGVSTNLLPEGVYTIRPKLTGEARLLCDGLLTTTPTPIGEDFEYTFELLSDCNRNGVHDTDDIATLHSAYWDIYPQDGKIDCCNPECFVDFNCDGGGDLADVQVFSDASLGDRSMLCDLLAGSDPSYWEFYGDFNQDGGIDNSDVFDLSNAIAGGGRCQN